MGVHGSNLLLPSAHSGTTIDLMPNHKWANIFQDILPIENNMRIGALRYRCIPIETSISTVSNIISHILSNIQHPIENFSKNHFEYTTSATALR